jgi:prepilin-type N-terminal cleavage/methylation domain-containing protein
MAARIRRVAGFTLIEVVIAVGIFAVAVSVMLGLLPSVTRSSGRSNDTLNALRLPDGLRIELKRMATTGGFAALAAQIKPLADPLSDTCVLVATRDASRVCALDYQLLAPGDRIESDAHYFLIEVWSFGSAPLAFTAGDAVLPMHVRVSWPYRIVGSSAVTLPADREHVDFNLALNR